MNRYELRKYTSHLSLYFEIKLELEFKSLFFNSDTTQLKMFTSEVKSKIGEDISILVQPSNHPYHYLCECGDASQLTVKEVQNSQAVFISHTHIDHFVNFDAVIRHQIGIQRRIVICGPEHIAKQVQAKLKSYTWNLIQKGAIIYEIREMINDNCIDIYELEPPEWELKKTGQSSSNILFEDDSFVVSGILLDHKTPTLAYKFQERDTVKIDIKASGFKGGQWVKELKVAYLSHRHDALIQVEHTTYQAQELFHLLNTQKGDTLGIIMDHAANDRNHQKINVHFQNCRRVFIESFYKNEDASFAEANFHSYSSKSGEIMKKSNVVDPIPVHFSRKYTQEDIDLLIEEFEKALKEGS